MDRIVAELKQILKKDFNRRMVEGTAFKGESTIFSFISGMGELKSFVRYLWRLAFENWWDDQQKREEKGSVFKKTASSTQQVSSSASMASSATSMKKTTDKKVAIGFEGFNFGMGMGLRAAMPKLPSFRVILLIHLLIYFLWFCRGEICWLTCFSFRFYFLKQLHLLISHYCHW